MGNVPVLCWHQCYYNASYLSCGPGPNRVNVAYISTTRMQSHKKRVVLQNEANLSNNQSVRFGADAIADNSINCSTSSAIKTETRGEGALCRARETNRCCNLFFRAHASHGDL